MNKRLYKRWSLFLTVIFAAFLGGCFGFVSDLLPQPPGGGSAPDTAIVGVVLAPDSVGDSLMTARRLSPFAWLSPVAEAFTGTVPVAGATVQALEVPSLEPIGESVQTDTNGRYTLSGLPEGIEVVVVAVKQTEYGTLRLSTYVRNVGKNTVADADPASSLATELLAAKFKESSDYQVSEQDWLMAISAADRILDKITSEGGELDFTVGGTIISDGVMGSGIQEAFRENNPEVDGFLPENPDMDVAHAKKLVQTLRDAGYSLNDTVETRLLQYGENLQEEVVPHLEHAVGALVRTIQHYDLCYEYEDSEDDEDAICVFQDEDGYRSTITFYAEEETEETLTGRFTIETEGPDAADYYVSFESTFNETDNQMSGEIEARFIDDVLVEPLEISGALTAVVEYTDATIHLVGEITSALIEVYGSVYIDYRETVVEYEDDEYWVFDQALIEITGDVTFPDFNFGGGILFVIEASPDDDFGFYILPTEIRLGGSWYDFEEEPIAFFGDLEFRLRDIDDIVQETLRFPGFELIYEGRTEAPGQAPIEFNANIISSQDFPAANWGFPQDEWYGGLESQVTYRRGELTLDGSVRIAAGEETIWVELDMTSDEGLDIYLTYGDGSSAQGHIKRGDKVLAEFAVSAGVITIEYRDGSFETLF